MLNLVCFLEEPSAKDMLEAVLPKLLLNRVSPQYVIFEGKQDLRKRIQNKIQHYNIPDSVFLILFDQDAGDCRALKQELEGKLANSGKAQKTLIRIACCELESFFLGDLEAVEKGLGLSGLAKKQNSQKFRTPDNLTNAAEELQKISKQKYRKREGSRRIAPHLAVDGSNRSGSFNVLVSGIKELVVR